MAKPSGRCEEHLDLEINDQGMMRWIIKGVWVLALFSGIGRMMAQNTNKAPGDGRVDYLVITSEELKSEFVPLIEWKIRKGLSAEIITLSEIYAKYEESSNQLKIKRCLSDYYRNNNLIWALLGGDEDVVPVQGCFAEVNTNNYLETDWNIPTDLFYACFDKRFDWNSFVDDKIGEIHRDGIDLVPEIFLTRIPVHSREQVRNFVNKSLWYEINPTREEFAEKMLMSGIESWTSWDGKSDNHHRSELMYNSYVKDNWQGKKINFFDTGTDFPDQAAYQVSASNLKKQLHQGYGLVHFAGPGSRSAFLMETGTPFDIYDAVEITGSKPGIWLSTNSEANAFDSEGVCMSEVLLSNPNGGCIAFFGNTRIGFGFSDTSLSLGPSYEYNAVFLNLLFRGSPTLYGNSFGEIAAKTKSNFILNGEAGGAYQFLLYSMNAMGDPELPLLTGDPLIFENVRMFRLGNSLTVNTGGIKECRICITSRNLDDGYQEVVEGVSFHTFDNVPENFQVTITSHNYVPYLYLSGIGTATETKPLPRMQVFPNPFFDLLHIETDLSSGNLLVYDLHGKLIAESYLPTGSGRINLSEYADGIYLLNIISGNGTYWVKVLKR